MRKRFDAPAPLRVIPKGIPGPMLLANILINKYADHLPLYRQRMIFRRSGMEIDDVTIGGWVKQSIQLLEVIYSRIRDDLMTGNDLMADESTIRVLDRNKKGQTHLGYYWAYLDSILRCVLFKYEKGRAGKYVRKHLASFKGYVQTDAYAGYDNLPKVNGDIRLLGCWTHVRRKFFEALSVEAEQAGWFMDQIQLLYAIERYARMLAMTPAERLTLRENALPILAGINARMLELVPTRSPGNLLYIAMRYTLKQWDELLVYTTECMLEIDNNRVGNSIRPSALGRKNHLFAGDHEAARRGAVIYSILASCKARGINPLAYLADVLDKLPARKVNNIEDLLPWNWQPVDIPSEFKYGGAV